jgi:energy-coupling factor transporter transmembrane protein EcfT
MGALMFLNAYSAITLFFDLHSKIPIVWLSPGLRKYSLFFVIIIFSNLLVTDVPNYQILPITEEHIKSFRAAVDSVAREHKYLAFLEGPPLEMKGLPE